MATLQDRQSNADRAARETRFLEVLPTIDETLRFIGRRNRLPEAELEEFASEVKLAFVEDDYAVLARFEGRSSLKTYLVTVVQRMYLDRQRRLWGKWRPSAEARRLGPVALAMEQMIYRHGMTASEAAEALRTHHLANETQDELLNLAARLPSREPRARAQANGVDSASTLAETLAAPLVSPLNNLESNQTAARCQRALEESMSALPPEDRVVLRLRFEDSLSVADISRALSLDQKKLYKRMETMLASLRQHIEQNGLGWAEVAGLIERGQCHLRLPFDLSGEKEMARPSHVEATS